MTDFKHIPRLIKKTDITQVEYKTEHTSIEKEPTVDELIEFLSEAKESGATHVSLDGDAEGLCYSVSLSTFKTEQESDVEYNLRRAGILQEQEDIKEYQRQKELAEYNRLKAKFESK